MGDVLLMGPAIRAIAHRASVTLLAGPGGAAAARLLPGVDHVLVHALPWIVADPDGCDPDGIDALLEDVRALAPDEAVIFTSFHQSPLPLALLLRLAGVGRISAISDDYPGALLDVRHGVRDDMHEVERACSLAAAAGFPAPPGDDGRLAIRSTGPERTGGGANVVVHPGASVSARAWDPDRCRTLVRALARGGVRVKVTGTESEGALTAFVAGSHPLVEDLGGACDLAGLAEVLRAASVVVCGNTGPAHLAAAVGTPVVALYAPTVPAVRWRPWRVAHVLLGNQDIECRGCRARTCPVADHPCLDVPVSEVLAALERVVPELRLGMAA
ncbi:MAG TPA: glycosyltransferase family 9 protein [Acidimicrobiia bacterium]|nr:glycosyltransferase family 9 protein [Acidimicrobiia bacterium]